MILNILYFPDINFRLDIDFFFILSCTNVSEPPTLLQQREANGIHLKLFFFLLNVFHVF